MLSGTDPVHARSRSSTEHAPFPSQSFSLPVATRMGPGPVSLSSLRPQSSLESVVAASGARAADTKTLHERPAKIQQLEWRAPYASAGGGMADPVRGAVFAFYNDALYQIVVSYDRDRTNGLTNSEIIESLTALYGDPVIKPANNRPPVALPDTVVLAQWDSPASSLTLVRDAYTREFQLVLLSKAGSTQARTAIREAGRLDAIEAPRRELEERKKEVADAAGAQQDPHDEQSRLSSLTLETSQYDSAPSPRSDSSEARDTLRRVATRHLSVLSHATCGADRCGARGRRR